jgi:hypothetical protein
LACLQRVLTLQKNPAYLSHGPWLPVVHHKGER